jgi:hypothetical protein
MDFMYVPIIIFFVVVLGIASTVKHNSDLEKQERERIELLKKARKWEMYKQVKRWEREED